MAAVKGDSVIKTLLSNIKTNFNVNVKPVTPVTVTTNSIPTNVTDDVMITQIQKLDSIV